MPGDSLPGRSPIAFAHYCGSIDKGPCRLITCLNGPGLANAHDGISLQLPPPLRDPSRAKSQFKF